MAKAKKPKTKPKKSLLFQPGNKWAWKPGQTGNPNGRPRSDAKQIAEEFGLQPHARTDKTRDQHMFEVLYRRGCQGDMAAAKLYMGYRFGNPAQAVELDAKVDFTDMLTRIRERERQRQLAPLASGESDKKPNGHAVPATVERVEAEQATTREIAPRRRVRELPAPAASVWDGILAPTRDPVCLNEDSPTLGSWRRS